MPSLSIPKLLRAHPTETWLALVLLAISAGLSATSSEFALMSMRLSRDTM